MNIPFIAKAVDERFLNHRLRSTSLAGVMGGLVAIGLFAYRFYAKHIWSWDLFIVVATIVGVKLAVMTWYLLTD
jgi:hypothetical protein